MSVPSGGLPLRTTISGATEALGNDLGVTVRYTLATLLAWLQTQLVGLIGYSRQLATNGTGVYTGTVPAGLNYVVQPLGSNTMIIESFTVTGTAVSLTFKQMVIVTVLGVSVTALAVPGGAVAFTLIGLPVV